MDETAGTVRPGSELTLRVTAVAHGGHCVARTQGRVVFVRHALPGELVRAVVTDGEEGDRFLRADAVEVIEASPDRVEPPCDLAGPGGCGGCDWQHVAPPAQRRLKAEIVREQLRRLGRLDPEEVPWLADLRVEALPVAGRGDDGLGWRTRMRFAVDPRGRTGLRRARSHDLVAVESCPIAHAEVNAVGVGAKRWGPAVGVEVVVASPEQGPQRLVVIDPPATPGPAGRVGVPPLSAPASVALRGPDGLRRLRGRTWVGEEVVLDGERRTFRVTGSGFWQVHPAAAAALVDAVLTAADPRPGERALDLYCGVGLFAAALAARVGQTGTVLAVESDPRAAADARRNLHDLPHVTVEAGRVERVLPRGGDAGGRADVVVLDPPRTGAGRQVIEAITGLRPRVIVYVACDPAALARDVATAAARGYRTVGLRALDTFPMTQHVECVAILVPSDSP